LTLLTVEALSVAFGDGRARVPVVEGVSFALDRSETLGLVGESGCGKTVTVMSAIRLLPAPPAHVSGSVRFAGLELTSATREQLRELWGNRIGVVFQNPMTSLNPTFTVGFQLVEALRLHRDASEAEARERVVAMLERVGVSAARRRLEQHPHELSGGLRQRVMIAMALLCHPQLLVADEPTTALDVTLQAQILDLLRGLRAELGMAVLLITHDLGVVAELCDRVAVMYAGRIVETAPVRDLFARPRHPYTRGLLDSIPRLATPRDRALATIEGMVPLPGRRPAGCAFAERCPRAVDRCRREVPALAGESGHVVACWNPAA
jgi:oligopeptide/dipeptide ABC transporter ATP-binding protein